MNRKFIFLRHTADVKFRSYGKTMEEAFKNSVLALKETIAHEEKIKGTIRKKIIVDGRDNESLLYNFLEEFLFLLDSEGFIVNKVEKIKIKDMKLEADVSGDNAKKYNFTNSVKAVTYNNMFVRKEKDKYICQVVLDV